MTVGVYDIVEEPEEIESVSMGEWRSGSWKLRGFSRVQVK